MNTTKGVCGVGSNTSSPMVSVTQLGSVTRNIYIPLEEVSDTCGCGIASVRYVLRVRAETQVQASPNRVGLYHDLKDIVI